MLSSFNSSSPPAYWSRLIERGWKSTRFRNYYTAGPFETQLYKYSVSSRWLLVHNDQRDESFFSKFYHRCCWVGERNVWRTAEFCIFHFVCTSEILIITISIIVSMTTFRKYFVYLWNSSVICLRDSAHFELCGHPNQKSKETRQIFEIYELNFI
jgi:hypothetical protein